VILASLVAMAPISMSALVSKAAMERTSRNVSNVPTSEVTELIDHLVGAGEERGWNCDAEPEHFGSLEINDEARPRSGSSPPDFDPSIFCPLANR
jgi:hypothetical protein